MRLYYHNHPELRSQNLKRDLFFDVKTIHQASWPEKLPLSRACAEPYLGKSDDITASLASPMMSLL